MAALNNFLLQSMKKPVSISAALFFVAILAAVGGCREEGKKSVHKTAAAAQQGEKPATPSAYATPPVDPDKIPKIDFGDLPQENKNMFSVMASQLKCGCNCDKTLLDCLMNEAQCARAKYLAIYLLTGIAEGGSAEEMKMLIERDWRPSFCAPPKQIDTSLGHSMGPKDAPVQMVLFSDFQCPFCGLMAPVFREVQRRYPDKVRLIYIHFPLSGHAFAPLAARATEAAAKQGKFWEMHDLIYLNQAMLSEQALLEMAKALKLDVEQFEKDLNSVEVQKVVDAGRALGEKLEIKGTPAIFLNGVPYELPRQLEFFDQRIEDILNPGVCCKGGDKPAQ